MQQSVHLNVLTMGPVLLQTHAAVRLDGLEALVTQVRIYVYHELLSSHMISTTVIVAIVQCISFKLVPKTIMFSFRYR